jgi:hypothetical protein
MLVKDNVANATTAGTIARMKDSSADKANQLYNPLGAKVLQVGCKYGECLPGRGPSGEGKKRGSLPRPRITISSRGVNQPSKKLSRAETLLSMTHSYEMSRYASSHISLLWIETAAAFTPACSRRGLVLPRLGPRWLWHGAPVALTSHVRRYPILSGLSPKSEMPLDGNFNTWA